MKKEELFQTFSFRAILGPERERRGQRYET